MESLVGILLSTVVQLAGCVVLVALISVGVNWLAQQGRNARRPVLPSVPPSQFEAFLKQAKVYKIILPKNTDWQPERAKVLVEHLLSVAGGSLFLQIVAERGQVTWQLVVGPAEMIRAGVQTTGPHPATISQAIQSAYPEAEVGILDYQPSPFSVPFWRVTANCRLGREAHLPVKQVMDLKSLDPLVSLVQAMSVGLENGRSTITIYVDRFADEKDVRVEAGKLRRMNPLYQLGGGWVSGLIKGDLWVDRYEPDLQKVCETKLSTEALCWIWVVLQTDAADEEGLQRQTNLIEIIESQYSSAHNGFVAQPGSAHEVPTPHEARTSDAVGAVGGWLADPRWRQSQMLLSMSELASLWHLPHHGFSSTRAAWIVGGQPPAELVRDSVGIVLGDAIQAGHNLPVRLREEDRVGHVSIVGKTRTGKSTFMHHLIHQDIAEGRGVGVIDPHGDLVQDILQLSVPKHREADVVLIDIANKEHPPPLNLLRTPDSSEVAVSQVTSILEKLYGEFVRVGDTLRVAIMTLANETTPTLADAARLFRDIEYRQRLVNSSDNPVVHEYWLEYEGHSVTEQKRLADTVTRRLRRLYGNTILSRMLCHPDGLAFARMVEERRIVLVSLKASSQEVPESERRLLGMIVLMQLQQALDQSKSRVPFYLYIDEVQDFVTTTLDTMLSEMGKFGLRLTLANQYLGQLKGPMLEAVLGNVGATVAFQVGPDDARNLAPYFRPEFAVDDLTKMNVHQAAVKVRAFPAFNITTRSRDRFEKPLPPEQQSGDSNRVGRIRQTSVDLHTPKSREEVQAWLDKRNPQLKHPGPKKRAKGGNQKDDWVVTD